jgi:NAD+ kinase
MASAGGEVADLDDDRAQLRVREPFVADGPPMLLPSLWLRGKERLTVVSKMREGRIYLDGPHEVVPMPMGARLTLHAQAPPLMLYATDEMRMRRETARKNTRRP